MAVTAATLQAFRFKNGALFNVHLDEAERGGIERRLADSAGIEAEGANCVFQRDAISIFEREQRRIEAPGNRAAADKRNAKAHALFLGEGNDFDGQRQLEFLRQLDPLERQRHAEDAVKSAGVGHGVNVRAQDEPFAARAWQAARARAGCLPRLIATVIPRDSMRPRSSA